MAVKPGYKQTEVGVIPEDWDVKQIGEFTDCTAGGTPSTLVPQYWGGSIPWMSSGELHQKKITDVAGRITLEGLQNSSAKMLPLSCVLVGLAGQGKTRGTVAINLIPLCTNQSIAAIYPNSAFVPMYLYYNLESRYEELRKLSSGEGGRGGLNLKIIKSIPVPLPTLAEQEAIAETLSDMDAYIEALEQLIAKKRQIKQGAMQELLTGKRRLPGFKKTEGHKQTEVGVIPEDWEVKPLGDLFNFSGGLSASRAQLSSEGYCYLHYGDIHTSKKIYIDVSAQYQNIPKLDISLRKVPQKSLLDDGDVVFVDASEDDEGTSKHIIIVNKEKIPFISGLHTIVAKGKTAELNHQYRRYCFQTEVVKRQFYFYAVGTKVSGISKANIGKIMIPIPSLPEQEAIAEALSDMDAEIATLEDKLAKARQIKQGMMQELLTGRIRLV